MLTARRNPRPLHATSDRRDRGFTLVEVMVALVVFAVGALSMVALFPLGSRSVADAGQQTRASELATTTMERLLVTPYLDPTLDAGAHTATGSPFSNIYHVTWDVEDNQPVAGCKRITITVRWPLATSTTRVRLVGVASSS
jgi:type IV pilus assembly protein PilV